MTNSEARFNNSLRPRKPEGSLGRTAQDVHLDSHTAPELWAKSEWASSFPFQYFRPEVPFFPPGPGASLEVLEKDLTFSLLALDTKTCVNSLTKQNSIDFGNRAQLILQPAKFLFWWAQFRNRAHSYFAHKFSFRPECIQPLTNVNLTNSTLGILKQNLGLQLSDVISLGVGQNMCNFKPLKPVKG